MRSPTRRNPGKDMRKLLLDSAKATFDREIAEAVSRALGAGVDREYLYGELVRMLLTLDITVPESAPCSTDPALTRPPLHAAGLHREETQC